MLIIRPNSLPRLWWLTPWSYARHLHRAATAIKGYADRMDRVDDLQRKIIEDQSKEIQTLRRLVLSSKRHSDA